MYFKYFCFIAFILVFSVDWVVMSKARLCHYKRSFTNRSKACRSYSSVYWGTRQLWIFLFQESGNYTNETYWLFHAFVIILEQVQSIMTNIFSSPSLSKERDVSDLSLSNYLKYTAPVGLHCVSQQLWKISLTSDLSARFFLFFYGGGL